ncbi:hypothetical protein OEK23_003619 [Vibrio cholerae]|nr:hypothetical protein [Vibrio cholerae]
MIDYFRSLPAGHYPPDGCALLVKDAWETFLCAPNLPKFADRFVTVEAAQQEIDRNATLIEPIPQPEELAMVVAQRGAAWHCGVFTAAQCPGYVIHTMGGVVRIETLAQFKRRYDLVEFYRYVAHRDLSTSGQNG